MFQAITTRYFGPTHTRGSRIKAYYQGGSLTVPYDYALNADNNHRAAAIALQVKLGWRGDMHSGRDHNSDGVHVFAS
jgi:hypothetical protein